MNAKTMNASDVRKDWGNFIDNIVRTKPQFVKRSRDNIFALSVDLLKDVLSIYPLTAQIIIEEDGTYTASLEQIDIIVNGDSQENALDLLSEDLLAYSEEYYEEFERWSVAPNRKSHIPYVLKVLSQKNAKGVRGLIQCQHGKN